MNKFQISHLKFTDNVVSDVNTVARSMKTNLFFVQLANLQIIFCPENFNESAYLHCLANVNAQW